jgi:hypothetical protein
MDTRDSSFAKQRAQMTQPYLPVNGCLNPMRGVLPRGHSRHWSTGTSREQDAHQTVTLPGSPR